MLPTRAAGCYQWTSSGTKCCPSQSSEDTYQSLSKYAINLIEAARNGKLDPVIGRDEEICRVLQILSRRTKNNPVLIGEPGTGKTAIVEGRLSESCVEMFGELENKQIVFARHGCAGCRCKNTKANSKNDWKSGYQRSNQIGWNIILFIDEIHTGRCGKRWRCHGCCKHPETGLGTWRTEFHRCYYPWWIQKYLKRIKHRKTIPDRHGRRTGYGKPISILRGLENVMKITIRWESRRSHHCRCRTE